MGNNPLVSWSVTRCLDNAGHLADLQGFREFLERRAADLSDCDRVSELTVNQPSYDFEGSSPSSPTNLFNGLVDICFPASQNLAKLGSIWEASEKGATRHG